MAPHNRCVKQEHKRIKQILVKNLKKYRAKLNLTQEQSAERAGVAYKYWQRLEMDSQADLPSLPIIFKMAEALKVEASQLLE